MKTLKTLALCAVLFPASSSADEQIFCERFVCLLYPGETDCRFRPQVSECERIGAFEFYKSRQMYGTPIASMATLSLIREKEQREALWEADRASAALEAFNRGDMDALEKALLNIADAARYKLQAWKEIEQ